MASPEKLAILASKRKDMDWNDLFIGYTQSLGFTGFDEGLIDDAYHDEPAFPGSGEFDDNWDVWDEIKDIITDDALQQIMDDLDGFVSEAEKFIRTDLGLCDRWNQAGVDFNFTRNGHGAGFWDGDWEHGKDLTYICRSYGTFQMVVIREGEDNELTGVYFHG